MKLIHIELALKLISAVFSLFMNKKSNFHSEQLLVSKKKLNI